jgi:uncharacterized protein (TIGR02246 family)
MKAKSTRADAESQIRDLISDRIEAIHAKDIDALMSHYSPDVMIFDVVNPLRYVGSDAVRERAREWFTSYQGQIGYEVRDLTIAAGDEVAFCNYLSRTRGALTGGEAADMWVRATLCLRNTNGGWKIEHEHQSVPFDPKSGKASLDIKP